MQVFLQIIFVRPVFGPYQLIAVFYTGLGHSFVSCRNRLYQPLYKGSQLYGDQRQRKCKKEEKTMQAVMETIFDVIYLTTVISLGIIMIRKSRGRMQYKVFGIMAVILGAGDSFHLIPRAVALCTTGLEHYTQALGIGKLVTSITMTIFYILLYRIWRMRYHVTGKNILTAAVYFLAALRIVLCLMPQNQWTSANAPLQWGIYRNFRLRH